MLKRTQRLNTREVDAVFTRGRFIRSKFFTLKWIEGEAQTKFGVAVGTKVAKSAVRRNRAKRQIRVMLYEVHPRVRPGAHCVIIAAPSALDAPFKELRHDIEDLFRRAKLSTQTKK